MSERATWLWCVGAGLVAFICSSLFGRIPGLVACGPTGGLGPIIAFEFVRSPADVAALFGSEPCTSRFAAAQFDGLLLDCLGFIPAYTAFLFLAARGAADAAGLAIAPRHLLLTTILVAGLADEIEGVLLWLILRDPPGDQSLIDALWWAVHIKFAWLGFATATIGAVLAATRRSAGMAVGLIVTAGGLWALRGLVAAPVAMMAGFTWAWITLLLAATAGAFSPRLFDWRTVLARPSA